MIITDEEKQALDVAFGKAGRKRIIKRMAEVYEELLELFPPQPLPVWELDPVQLPPLPKPADPEALRLSERTQRKLKRWRAARAERERKAEKRERRKQSRLGQGLPQEDVLWETLSVLPPPFNGDEYLMFERRLMLRMVEAVGIPAELLEG